MSDLWNCLDESVWLGHLEAAESRIPETGKEKLIELDQWFVSDLPGLIRSRDQPHITKEDLVRLVGNWYTIPVNLQRTRPQSRLLVVGSAVLLL